MKFILSVAKYGEIEIEADNIKQAEGIAQSTTFQDHEFNWENAYGMLDIVPSTDTKGVQNMKNKVYIIQSIEEMDSDIEGVYTNRRTAEKALVDLASSRFEMYEISCENDVIKCYYHMSEGYLCGITAEDSRCDYTITERELNTEEV